MADSSLSRGSVGTCTVASSTRQSSVRHAGDVLCENVDLDCVAGTANHRCCTERSLMRRERRCFGTCVACADATLRVARRRRHSYCPATHQARAIRRRCRCLRFCCFHLPSTSLTLVPYVYFVHITVAYRDAKLSWCACVQAQRGRIACPVRRPSAKYQWHKRRASTFDMTTTPAGREIAPSVSHGVCVGSSMPIRCTSEEVLDLPSVATPRQETHPDRKSAASTRSANNKRFHRSSYAAGSTTMVKSELPRFGV